MVDGSDRRPGDSSRFPGFRSAFFAIRLAQVHAPSTMPVLAAKPLSLGPDRNTFNSPLGPRGRFPGAPRSCEETACHGPTARDEFSRLPRQNVTPHGIVTPGNFADSGLWSDSPIASRNRTARRVVQCWSRWASRQSKSVASTASPGPKARATQGRPAPARRRRSRMKRMVGDDMFPSSVSTPWLT